VIDIQVPDVRRVVFGISAAGCSWGIGSGFKPPVSAPRDDVPPRPTDPTFCASSAPYNPVTSRLAVALAALAPPVVKNSVAG